MCRWRASRAIGTTRLRIDVLPARSSANALYSSDISVSLFVERTTTGGVAIDGGDGLGGIELNKNFFPRPSFLIPDPDDDDDDDDDDDGMMMMMTMMV